MDYAKLLKDGELRIISFEELADLPESWENPTCDTSKYIQNVFVACEVKEEIYREHKKDGGLCQNHEGKYYIA